MESVIPELARAAVSPDEFKHARKLQDEAVRQEALSAIKQGLVPPLAKMSPALIDNIWLRLEADLSYHRQQIRQYKADPKFDPEGYTAKYVLPSEEKKASELLTKCLPYRAEWEKRGGWQRWMKVTNGNGHVHLSQDCKTCFPDTQWGLVPDLSGLNAKEMVEEVGEMACTVCFPWAPATKGWQRTVQEREDIKRANQMEKVRKAAEKEAKAIQDVDGGRLKDASGYSIATLVAAQRELLSAMEWLEQPTYVGNPYTTRYQEFIDRAVPAIGKKTSRTNEEVMAEARRKLAERKKRERR